MVQTKHYLISGRVQGVGFRAFVHRQAVQLGLKGWVRNLIDGRVEAWVQGDKGSMDRLESLLKSGPPHAKVEHVAAADKSPVEILEFSVRGDGTKPCSDEP